MALQLYTRRWVGLFGPEPEYSLTPRNSQNVKSKLPEYESVGPPSEVDAPPAQ